MTKSATRDPPQNPPLTRTQQRVAEALTLGLTLFCTAVAYEIMLFVVVAPAVQSGGMGVGGLLGLVVVPIVVFVLPWMLAFERLRQLVSGGEADA